VNLYLRLLLVRLRSRRAGRLGVWDTAVTPFRVLPNDLDVLGHMNNGRYLTLLDVARIDLMTRSGFWSRLKARGWYPVVAGQTITYRRSLEPGQRFEVHTRILGFDDRSSFLEQTFRTGEKVYAQAIVRARFLKRAGGTVARAELEEFAGGFPAHLVLPQWLTAWADAGRIDAAGRRPDQLD
jgi:YbgC/YbaW family acyl-CoA thioester hydrolase